MNLEFLIPPPLTTKTNNLFSFVWSVSQLLRMNDPSADLKFNPIPNNLWLHKFPQKILTKISTKSSSPVTFNWILNLFHFRKQTAFNNFFFTIVSTPRNVESTEMTKTETTKLQTFKNEACKEIAKRKQISQKIETYW